MANAFLQHDVRTGSAPRAPPRASGAGAFGVGAPLAVAAALLGGILWRKAAKRRQPATIASDGTTATITLASDDVYLGMARARLAALVPPAHSGFRVGCLVIYTDARGAVRTLFGTNIETQNIGGSLCAERCAMAALRARNDGAVVRALYLVADGDGHITPGMLCREFLHEFVSPTARIVMAALGGGKGGAPPHVSDLATLYPCPPLFRGVPRGRILAAMTMFAARGCADPGAVAGCAEGGLYARARAATARDAKDCLYPVRLAAGVRFADGRVALAAQSKALEYGASLDCVAKLAPALEAQRERGNAPAVLLVCDQRGILHAPLARARAYLFENGHGALAVFAHAPDGSLRRWTVDELVPDSPRVEELFGEAGLAGAPDGEFRHAPPTPSTGDDNRR